MHLFEVLPFSTSLTLNRWKQLFTSNFKVNQKKGYKSTSCLEKLPFYISEITIPSSIKLKYYKTFVLFFIPLSFITIYKEQSI